jgi:two-component system response regulator PilR (NtrC family)
LARLLLVEDEAISRFQLTQFLTDEGYTVIPVATGEEAVKLLPTENFDVVVTDLKLAGRITGTDVLDAFERVSPGKGKILLTAYPAHEVQAEYVGAVYVPKPVQLDELLVKIKGVLP